MPVSISLTLRVCADDVSRVQFEWRSEMPEVGGLTSPQLVGADECVRFNFELPPHDQTLNLALYDADAGESPEGAAGAGEAFSRGALPRPGRLLWQKKTYLSLAEEKPALIPRPD